RFLFSLSDWAVVDRLVCRETNAFRRELGLTPIRGHFIDWSFSPMQVLGLFPEWFAPNAPDWPPNVRLCQFPLYDASDTTRLPLGATASLDDDNPTVVFTPGSAMRHSSEFFATCIEACRVLGTRGVLVSPFRDQIPRALPPFVHVIESIPFSLLLNRARAI